MAPSRKPFSESCLSFDQIRPRDPQGSVVGPGRLELPTSRLSGVCSNQLSYRPLKRHVPYPSALDRARTRSEHAIAPQPVMCGCGVLRKEKRRRRHPATCLDVLNEPIRREPWRFILRKEVIQPQVPLRLPCYDFTPVADPTVVGCLHCWLAHRLRVKPTPMV